MQANWPDLFATPAECRQVPSVALTLCFETANRPACAQLSNYSKSLSRARSGRDNDMRGHLENQFTTINIALDYRIKLAGNSSDHASSTFRAHLDERGD